MCFWTYCQDPSRHSLVLATVGLLSFHTRLAQLLFWNILRNCLKSSIIAAESQWQKSLLLHQEQMDFFFKEAGLLVGVDEAWQESLRNKTNPLGREFSQAWHWVIEANVNRGWGELWGLWGQPAPLDIPGARGWPEATSGPHQPEPATTWIQLREQEPAGPAYHRSISPYKQRISVLPMERAFSGGEKHAL